MKKILGFLLLLLATLTSIPVNPAFATHDLDRDGILDEIDSCPNLQEDNEGTIDGCPSNFVHGMMRTMME